MSFVSRVRDRLVDRSVNLYNLVVQRRSNPAPPEPAELKELNEVRERACRKTDINEHLVSLFVEALSVHPKLIVELGVRGGESTFVLERVAKLAGGTLISVDIEDCRMASSWDRWLFVQENSVKFGRRFDGWCSEIGVTPEIDVLFIDTSHLYEDTLEEMIAWFPHLAPRAKVFLHDTNLRRYSLRRNHSVVRGWDNARGVIRALEEYLKASFNERRDFVDCRSGWLIKHTAISHGFTILERLDLPTV